MTRRLEEVFSLLAVSRGVRDHRGSFFGLFGLVAQVAALSSALGLLLVFCIVVLGRSCFTMVARLFVIVLPF